MIRYALQGQIGSYRLPTVHGDRVVSRTRISCNDLVTARWNIEVIPDCARVSRNVVPRVRHSAPEESDNQWQRRLIDGRSRAGPYFPYWGTEARSGCARR
jgi:hypothetical protein